MNLIRLRNALVVVGALAMSTPLIAQDILMRGEVVKIDEAAGKVSIRQEQSGTTGTRLAGVTEEFGVNDGLLFNALKLGDEVAFSVETVNGQKRISKLTRK